MPLIRLTIATRTSEDKILGCFLMESFVRDRDCGTTRTHIEFIRYQIQITPKCGNPTLSTTDLADDPMLKRADPGDLERCRQCKAARCQENKEDADRFVLGALRSCAVLARSAFVQFPSLQVTRALAGQEKVSRHQFLRRELVGWLA
ncbi:hypothetical protein KIN20_007485 [Parelaphostrongylus tenuis]|uniref:Uncharacterized protein n=1 Tax=Parelaphostrongylus tenuis TaxID=148309 RepID=A0AAD5QK29_PARTN|nr:hypothetical protein KIN20_007485 [Parelaphostrongylus tenuis]